MAPILAVVLEHRQGEGQWHWVPALVCLDYVPAPVTAPVPEHFVQVLGPSVVEAVVVLGQ